MDLLQNPLFQAVLAPLLACALAAVVLGLLTGGRALLGVALAVGFATGYLLMEGLPPFPPPAAKQKVFYLVLLGGLTGAALDWRARPPWILWALALLWPVLILLWLAWRRLTGGLDGTFWLTVLLLWMGAALVLGRLVQVAQGRDGLEALVLLLVTAVGASGVAMGAASLTLALQFAALAAACGALALWGWINRFRHLPPPPFAAAALLAGGGTLVALAGVLGLYTFQISYPAMALLLLIPFAHLLLDRLPLGGEGTARVLGPVVLAVLTAVPAAAAVALAFWSSSGGSGYGGY
ncbi:MAG: hypothetical protein R3310_00180 [Candidatus Competibacteraceae bacterium]|nr:hypothetical protein [Candidatus Competibacteraceae bacterium]